MGFLFSLYTTPISDILSHSSINFHLYADDTQLYLSFSSSDSTQCLASLSTMLDRLFLWYCENKLSINPDKTEFLLIGTPQQRLKLLDSSIIFRGNTITQSESARNLGVVLDSNLNFDCHISSICRSSFFFVRQLRQLRSSLDFDSAVILANSIVHSKLDYCNALFSGLPQSSISRLQRIQNSLARIVCNSTRFSASTTSLLQRLHWLPITQRIKYKTAVLTFKALHSGKPSYLSDLLIPYCPSRNLRSSSSNLLVIPDIRSSIGRRSFSFHAPSLWNSLPDSLRTTTTLSTFCKGLKTHLFPS